MHFNWVMIILIFLSNTIKAADSDVIDFSLFDIQTNLPVNLVDYQDKVIFLDFWASWCSSCAKALPLFSQWEQEFGDDFVVISVNVDENKSDGLAIVKKLSLNYPIAYDGNLIVAKLYNVTSLPISFIIDSKGVIQYKHVGFKSSDVKQLKSVITRLVKSK